LKIFQINASYKPAYIYGGPTMSVSKLSEELSKQGIDVEVITTTANGPDELNVKAGETTMIEGVNVTYFKRITKDHTHFSPDLLKGLTRKIQISKQESRASLESRVENQETGSGGLREVSKQESGDKSQETRSETVRKVAKQESGDKSQEARSEGIRESLPIVHIHAWWNLVSIFACFVAKWKKVPVIISPRGTLSGYSFVNKNSGIKDYIHKFLGKSLLEYSYFHVTSEKEKRDVERLVQPKAVFVIPNFVRIPKEVGVGSQESRVRSQESTVSNEQSAISNQQSATGKAASGNTDEFGAAGREAGVESQDSRARNQQPAVSGQQSAISNQGTEKHLSSESSLRLLFISRVEEKKGLELLFECLKDFKANWSLDVAGSGEKTYVAKLKQMSEDLGISSRITWLGHVNNEQKFDVMAAHDVMVLPSYDENFANVVIESLSVGTSVLLTRNVGLADYAEINGLGWICERSKADLLSKLENIAAERACIEEIRTKAPRIIRRDFNEEHLVKEYIAMYEEVARKVPLKEE